MFAAIGILLTMRYGEMTSKELLSRFPELREMAPFKMYFDDGRAEGRAVGRAEGRAAEARAAIERQGRKKFGPPLPEHDAALAAVTDLERLAELSERLLDVNTWDELFSAT